MYTHYQQLSVINGVSQAYIKKLDMTAESLSKLYQVTWVNVINYSHFKVQDGLL